LLAWSVGLSKLKSTENETLGRSRKLKIFEVKNIDIVSIFKNWH